MQGQNADVNLGESLSGGYPSPPEWPEWPTIGPTNRGEVGDRFFKKVTDLFFESAQWPLGKQVSAGLWQSWVRLECRPFLAQILKIWTKNINPKWFGIRVIGGEASETHPPDVGRGQRFAQICE